jgi:riboflavin synthase
MFTGIIEEIGVVSARSGSQVTVLAQGVLDGVSVGDSIAIDGACMTVADLSDEWFRVDVSPESFAHTTLGDLKPGDAVNLERAMVAGDRFGGHFVQGHVDGVGRIDRVQPMGEFSVWTFQAPDEVAKYLVPKGSVTVDGISLTVVDPRGDTFDVAIIPETLKRTKLHSKQAGDRVNMEADMLGKHIYHYVRGSGGGISKELLARHGFA